MQIRFLFFIFYFSFSCVFAQKIENLHRTKTLVFSRDTIAIDSVSINNTFFKVMLSSGVVVDSSFYKIDFLRAKLIFRKNIVGVDSVKVNYLKYPSFLTRDHTIYDKSKVVVTQDGSLYRFDKPKKGFVKPFDGLSTSGSITRGVTVGNNQNATVNSNLDLQISGKISDRVSLRASIQDSNIPLQEGGYSQKIDEFDQLFMEIFADQWRIKAGDLFIENRTSSFLNFSKKAQGVSSLVKIGKAASETNITASAALVRGQYTKSSFTGQEGNQGPYKLRGADGALYVLVISGSERVYVNGRLLSRGENKDYIIDYNAGEILFTTLFPISSEMRIVVEYQYSDRNFSRYIAYTGATHETENWNFGGYLYAESDIKNQPLQQNLSQDQVNILQQAGDNVELMTANSAYLDDYSVNKILYKKTTTNGVEIFEFSNNPNDALYNVKFTFVGSNKGNYNLANSNTIGKIFQYIAPINGVLQGSYSPVSLLISPNKIQIASFFAKYNPSSNTTADFEIGISNNDLNLFSNIDDDNNKGVASRFNFSKNIILKKSKLQLFSNLQYLQENFKPIERLNNIEFNRDWNIVNTNGNQSLLHAGANYAFNKNLLSYQLEKLDFADNFEGIRHRIDAAFVFKNIKIDQKTSILKSNSSTQNSTFFKHKTQILYQAKKKWAGATTNLENNKVQDNQSLLLDRNSQKFKEFSIFAAKGDSTKIFTEMGYLYLANDSLQNNQIKPIATSNTLYIKSKLIQNKRTNLSVFANYRNLQFKNNTPNEPSINTRILYNNAIWNQFVQTNTTYETLSGTIAQQEFTYLEVNQGQGLYTWNDYNNNGIQELQEFEIAPFPDQAKYIRIFLPNQIFIKTNQIKFSQAITISPAQWANKSGFKKKLSKFFNQTAINIDQKTIKNQDFNFNPFNNQQQDLLAQNTNIRNTLFYNRGKQKNTFLYNYIYTQTQNLLATGKQTNNLKSNQIQYTNLFQKRWLLQTSFTNAQSNNQTENYQTRNFELQTNNIEAKISYLFSKNTSISIQYNHQNKKNKILLLEQLSQNHFSTQFNLNNNNNSTITGKLDLYNNNFVGNATTPVAFQMLEGLQPGKNTTWQLLLQKKITQYLDININYQGRKSTTLPAIHTGNIQLRAFF